MSTSGAFGGREYESRDHLLRPLSAAEAAALGAEMAATDPWARLGFSADGLAGALAPRERIAPESPVTFGLEGLGGALAGAVSVRPVWLRGPYLALLFVRPQSQSRGTGLAALEWMEAEAGRAGANSLWTAVSAFNDRAFSFYRRFGFEEVALLPDLVMPGEDERLLRKPLRVAVP
ncbi:N-acetyltransferase [Aurantimonas sp. VKM B-3413]|uniref:GNAT family N-acetyltransferase n=1 Tax=Aurantimonas sp. VKM B-3413 TaxID=2779401 RepID=UPI001E58384F|nr:GNAT family N-acetyltransferase [Aurantimonas sp. VKM B-3413]MCB8839540.1 GNAT family N-acetyltransferase [Aurantimonas sp. VKM B-3413]